MILRRSQFKNALRRSIDNAVVNLKSFDEHPVTNLFQSKSISQVQNNLWSVRDLARMPLLRWHLLSHYRKVQVKFNKCLRSRSRNKCVKTFPTIIEDLKRIEPKH